jgi:hypothetical protein
MYQRIDSKIQLTLYQLEQLLWALWIHLDDALKPPGYGFSLTKRFMQNSSAKIKVCTLIYKCAAKAFGAYFLSRIIAELRVCEDQIGTS